MNYDKIGSIYCIFLCNVPVYVGQTRQALKDRMRSHLNGNRSPVAKFLKNVHAEDLKFVELEQVEGPYLDARETHWIAELGTRHPNGLNHTSGGHSGGLHSEASKQRMSVKMRAVCADENYAKELAERNKRLWNDAEYRRKQAEGRRQAVQRPEYLARMAEVKTAYWQCSGRKEAMSSIVKAQWLDPDQRKKKSDAIRAALSTPEAKEKSAERARKRWENPEYRLKRQTSAKTNAFS